MNNKAIGDCDVEQVEFTVQCNRYSKTKRRVNTGKEGVTDELIDMEFNGESITMHPDQYDTCYVMNDSGETISVIKAHRWHDKKSLLNILEAS